MHTKHVKTVLAEFRSGSFSFSEYFGSLTVFDTPCTSHEKFQSVLSSAQNAF